MGPATLVVRRAVTQPALVAALLAVVVAGATVLGLCTQLLTVAQDDGLRAALGGADAAEVDVRASFTVVAGRPAEVVAEAEETLASALAPLDAATSAWVISPLRELAGGELAGGGLAGGPAEPTGGLAYLTGAADVADHAGLVAGRWPVATGSDDAWETAVPTTTAQLLGLRPGSELSLGAAVRDRRAVGATGAEPPSDAVRVVVVGTFRPEAADAAWTRDPLRGAGDDPAHERPGSSGRIRLPAYGPFVVDTATLLASPGGVEQVSVVAHPDPATVDRPTLAAVAGAVGEVRRDLAVALAERATAVRVVSGLPATAASAATQQRVTGSGVLVVALLGIALTGTALALAARLVAERRATETALLAARGAGRGRLVLHAALESVAVAVVGATLAVPASVAAYRTLGRVPALAAAGVGAGSTVTPALVLTVLAGAVVLAALLVVPAWRADASAVRVRWSPRGDLARSGADVVLVALAVAAAVGLRDHRVVVGGAVDPVLVAAPVLCLLAGAALALRVVPEVTRLAEHVAARSRRLVVPLAGWDLARRTQATGPAFLLVLATAVGTFAVSANATWTQSQEDQATARVGTELSVGAATVPPLVAGAVLTAATGGTARPVTDRPVSVGRVPVGDPVPRLLAVDTTRAADPLRGRLPAGESWERLTADLAPTDPVDGLPVGAADGTLRLTLTGTGTGGGLPLRARPTVVVQEESGDRVALTGTEVVLDGRPQTVVVTLPDGASAAPAARRPRVVALRLPLAVDPAADLSTGSAGSAGSGVATVAVTVTGEVEDAPLRDGWTARDIGVVTALGSLPTTTTRSPAGAPEVTVRASVPVSALATAPAELVLTAFAEPPAVPVVLSEDLATSVSRRVGQTVLLTVAATTVPARVVAVAPYVPSVPDGPAILADRDMLSRLVLAQGGTTSLTDRWWVAGIGSQIDAVAGLRAAGLGDVVSRDAVAQELRAGPLRVGLPTALAVLVVAAVLLALVGTTLHAASGVAARGVEVARLVGLGLSQRTVVAAIVLGHTALTALAVLLGALVGAVVSWTVCPGLAVSPTGTSPVPVALVRWPWATQAAFLAALLVLVTAVAVPVTLRLVRGATAAHLRLDGPP